MKTDDAARWREIEDLLDAALDLPEAQREAFLTGQDALHPELAQRVRALLAAESKATTFLESGPRQDTAESTAAPPSLGQVGPWKILHLLGRGGMGEVYAAERADGHYQHSVALKILQGHQADLIARFETERQILAQLNHAHIARLIDGGLTSDGRPYMAMEYVRGSTLDRYLQSAQPDLKTRLALFRKLCLAVSYAHSHLIVHRDIKPDNVLITADGEPKLLDFGIAKLTGAGLNAQATQAIATPNYAAPEQLRGGLITTATDVYGIGATLYFLLCEKTPLDLDGASLPQVLDRLMHEEPRAPSSHLRIRGLVAMANEVAGDLDAICAKAMAKEPDARYASVDHLLADIDRHLQHETVLARPPRFTYRLGRYLRRYRWPVAAACAITLSLVVGLAATSWQAHVAAVERDSARREAARMSTLRSSILRLFRSAAHELDTDQLTARDLFSQSAQNIERDFGNDPASAAALMQMLGELQLFTEDYASAKTLLERAHALDAQAIAPDVLADIRFDLAHIAYRDGDYVSAQRLYNQASKIWQDQPERYPAERIAGATLASQLARAEGQTAEAVALLTQAATDALAYWGDAHNETGVVLINLAVAQYYNNELPAALESCARSWAVWQASGRDDTPDALNLLANWGLFALRYGDAYEGERRLASALELRTKLYGASAAQATLMKNLGVAHRINGRRNAGMQLLEQAQWMAEKYAGAGGRLHAAASYDLATALIEDGLIEEGRAKLDTLLSETANKPFPWRYLAQGLRASLMLDPQDKAASTSLFTQALQGLQSIGESALNQLADGRRIYANWLAATGDPTSALAQMEQAIQEMTLARRAGHYAVLQMQAEQADLLKRVGRSAAAQELLGRAHSTALSELGPAHPITQSLQTRLATATG